MIQKLKNKLEELKLSISPTINNKRQFETNIKHKYMCERLSGNIEILEKHFNYIGKEVYQYINNNNVTTIEDYKIKSSEDITHPLFNKISKDPFIYTLEKFNELQKWYISYQIERISEQLIMGKLYLSSINTFLNLEYQWEIESKQQLIQFYKKVLDNHGA